MTGALDGERGTSDGREVVEPVPPLNIYEIGPTAFFASTADPRISYCLYVPHDPARRRHLLVAVHGTDRTAETYRDVFAETAERLCAVVVAPLFPAGLTAPRELESYKLLDEDLRSDLVLLSILDDVRRLYGIPAEPVLLYGFSGGGHFAHRFLYLHPPEIRAVAIGAPGLVTLLGDPRPWWVGTGDMERRFGVTMDLEAMRATEVMIYVGADDTDPEEIWIEDDDPLWIPGANDAGEDRLQRARSLHASLVDGGINAELVVVPGTAHDDRPWLDDVGRFFGSVVGSVA